MEIPTIQNPLDNETADKLSGLNKLGVKAVETEGETRKLFEPGPDKPKKGPGRPRKIPVEGAKQSTGQSQVPPPGAGPKVTVIQGFDARDGAKAVFKVLSGALERSTRCPDMALLPDEIEQLGELWGQVGNQYMPTLIGNHGPLIFACVTTAGVAFRLSQVAEAEIIKKQRARAEAQSAETVNKEAQKPVTPVRADDPFAGFAVQ